MRGKIIFIFEIVLMSAMYSQPVSKDLAAMVALRYCESNFYQSAPSQDNLSKSAYILDTASIDVISVTGKAGLYLVQMENGWILVSSDKAIKPILASSTTGRFPTYSDMPEGMKWLLSYYEKAIQYVRDSVPVRAEHEDWNNIINNVLKYRSEDILPVSYIIDSMSLVHWDQNDNNSIRTDSVNRIYNKFCPTWYTPSNGHTYVGCTAVAMGMVMWYYKWPYSASIPNTIDSLQHISEEKHIVTYNWDIMPTDIYNNSDTIIVNEVAGLLRDCGYASKMKYKNSGSGASLNDAEDAFEKKFHYANVSHWTKKHYSGSWINKLKTEISANRPVIYAGYSDHGGHAFVLYGYDSDSKFYINWGWGGGYENEGAYALDSLHPRGTLNGPYNDDHEALFGIEPDYPDCDLHSLTSTDISDTQFEVYNGGAITASNKTINSNQSGVIYSGRAVYISSPFEIKRGAHVHIAIRNMNCDLRANTRSPVVRSAPAKTDDIGDNVIKGTNSMCLFPNPAQTSITVSVVGEIGQVFVFNLNGQQVLQTELTDIDVSGLPQGMYILRAQTTDGIIYQGKFVKIVR